MERYRIIKEVGRGSYGVVWQAVDLRSPQHEEVAIKKLNAEYYYSAADYMNLSEVQSLMKVNNHPNIIKLKEIVTENNFVFLVLEYMHGSLYDRMVHLTKPFSETEIRNMCLQIFQGLAYMHQSGYFHRDLKPENLLVKNDVIKIGDLGSARETDTQRPYTYNVTTLWYRAPEVFLHSPVYNSAVDMWAMGAIMAELFTSQPLFQGPSEADVLRKICSVLGTPTESTWSAGLDLARNMYYQFPEYPGVRFSELLPYASSDAVDLIAKLLSWQPCSRPTAMQVLQHPFFRGCYHVQPTVQVQNRHPMIFKSLADMLNMAKQREPELLKQATSRLQSCTSGSKRVPDLNQDSILLPEMPFDFMSGSKKLDLDEDPIPLPEIPFDFMSGSKRLDLDEYPIPLPEMPFDFMSGSKRQNLNEDPIPLPEIPFDFMGG